MTPPAPDLIRWCDHLLFQGARAVNIISESGSRGPGLFSSWFKNLQVIICVGGNHWQVPAGSDGTHPYHGIWRSFPQLQVYLHASVCCSRPFYHKSSKTIRLWSIYDLVFYDTQAVENDPYRGLVYSFWFMVMQLPPSQLGPTDGSQKWWPRNWRPTWWRGRWKIHLGLRYWRCIIIF